MIRQSQVELYSGKLFEEVDLPAGVLNVVAGASREIGDYFVEHATPKMISFTGSTEVGQHVGQLAVAGEHLKRVALETRWQCTFSHFG